MCLMHSLMRSLLRWTRRKMIKISNQQIHINNLFVSKFNFFETLKTIFCLSADGSPQHRIVGDSFEKIINSDSKWVRKKK